MFSRIKKWFHRKALDFVIDQNMDWELSNGRRGIRLSFENRYLANAIFWRADMKKCEFNFAQLDGSNFWSAYMNKCKFDHAEMNFATFDQTNLFRADISSARLRQTTHQIHIRNRQKEDIIRIFDALDNMPDGEQKTFLKNFLHRHEVQRPRIH